MKRIRQEWVPLTPVSCVGQEYKEGSRGVFVTK